MYEITEYKIVAGTLFRYISTLIQLLTSLAVSTSLKITF